MGQFIVKLTDPRTAPPRDYYLEWSQIVDAPITYGMSRAAFAAYYREEHGAEEARRLPARLARVDRRGTSSLIGHTVEELAESNRAGSDGARLTLEELLELYCRRPAVDDAYRETTRHVAQSPAPTVVQRCRRCGCTDYMACQAGCVWVESDLCSACA